MPLRSHHARNRRSHKAEQEDEPSESSNKVLAISTSSSTDLRTTSNLSKDLLGTLPLKTLSLLVEPSPSQQARDASSQTPPLDSSGDKEGLDVLGLPGGPSGARLTFPLDPFPITTPPTIRTTRHPLHTRPLKSFSKYTSTKTTTRVVTLTTNASGLSVSPSSSFESTTISSTASSGPSAMPVSSSSLVSSTPTSTALSGVSTSSSIPNGPTNSNNAAASASTGFFQHKDEVGVIFAVIGGAIVALCAWLFYFLRRRRRTLQRIKVRPLIDVPKLPTKPPRNGTVDPYPVVLLQRSAPASGTGEFQLDEKSSDELKKKHFTLS